MGQNLDGYDFAAKGQGNAASKPRLPTARDATPARCRDPFPA